MSERYNGWANHATWLLALHIDNDEGTQSYWRERAEACSENWALVQELSGEFEDEYANHILQTMESAGVSPLLLGDILGSFFSDVVWEEIADHLKSE